MEIILALLILAVVCNVLYGLYRKGKAERELNESLRKNTERVKTTAKKKPIETELVKKQNDDVITFRYIGDYTGKEIVDREVRDGDVIAKEGLYFVYYGGKWQQMDKLY